MTRRLFAALAVSLVALFVLALPVSAHDATVELDCVRAVLHASNYPPGPHVAHARLTVGGTTWPLPDRAWVGPTADVEWPLAELTDQPGQLDLYFIALTDTGAAFQARASLTCVEVTTTSVAETTTSTSSTSTTVAATTTTGPSPVATAASVPPSPAGELPRTGSTSWPWLLGAACVGVGLAVAAGARRRTS